MQSMEKSSYNNRKYDTAASADHFNNHVILQSNSTTRKRVSKKDRHSKINTAQGLRDRRMRLSLDVAKKFFKLQDMLGFDKASNTIEWLLTKSKSAIQGLISQQLNRTNCSLLGLSDTSDTSSSSSECEVMSGIDSQPIVYKAKSTSSYKEKKRLDRGVRKSTYIHQSLAKETREQARERARKRTSEKRHNKLAGHDYGVSGSEQVMDQNAIRLGSWIPYGENQVQTVQYPSSQLHLKQGIVDDNSSAMPNSWSQSFLFNYHHNSGPSHEHQFIDFPILGKPWEGTDN